MNNRIRYREWIWLSFFSSEIADRRNLHLMRFSSRSLPKSLIVIWIFLLPLALESCFVDFNMTSIILWFYLRGCFATSSAYWKKCKLCWSWTVWLKFAVQIMRQLKTFNSILLSQPITIEMKISAGTNRIETRADDSERWGKNLLVLVIVIARTFHCSNSLKNANGCTALNDSFALQFE